MKKIRKYQSGGMRPNPHTDSGFSKATKMTKSVPSGGGGKNIGKPVKDVPFKKPLSTGQSLLLGSIVPFSGTAINVAARANYKGRQMFARKKGLYRDFYKSTGNVLQPNSPTGKKYLKDAGYGANKPIAPNRGDGGDSQPIIPIVANKPVDKTLVKPKENFFDFKAYTSGGVSSGPPPLRGPNPQVPPVKMNKGKMNNMTCPHRPDGIRGMGAAIKGHKFIGVK